jgi:hypothetical protein
MIDLTDDVDTCDKDVPFVFPCLSLTPEDGDGEHDVVPFCQDPHVTTRHHWAALFLISDQSGSISSIWFAGSVS